MPSLAHSAMVCTTPPTGGGHPHPPSHNTRALNRPSGSRAPSGEQQNPRLEGIVLTAQRTSTQKQYKSCWSKWVGWCHKQQVDPIHPSDLPISTLTKKCAMLLALSGSKRQSDLRALDIRFKKHIPEVVTFQLATSTKTRSSKNSIEFFFPPFTHNKKLCPVACLDSYIERSKAWRGVGNRPQPLFLSFQAPQKPVSSATIGRWFVKGYNEGGWC